MKIAQVWCELLQVGGQASAPPRTRACDVLIAGSIGAVLYLAFQLDARVAATVALAVLVGMALYDTIANRLRDRSGRDDRDDLGSQIGDLSRGSSDLARQVVELSRRSNEMGHVNKSVTRARYAVDPLAAEIGELGALVKQLAASVASHEAHGRRPARL
jgi:cyclic-di-GMP phosphodiesterase TipF (flagellum assembly factor)